jgi:hypothetical protein
MSSGQSGFWDVQERLRELSAQGDPLEKLAATVEFEMFRAELAAALGSRDRSRGGRPAFDAVLKFRMLVLQALHGLSLAQTEYLVADRLSWMRFCRLGPGDAVPDANTLWNFREALIATGAMERLFVRLDEAITGAGYLPMAGRSWTRRWWQHRASATRRPRRRGSRWARRPRPSGPTRGQGAPEGHRCALDGDVQQGETRPRRHAADRHRRAPLRLQVADLDRPQAWRDPARQDHGRGRP